MAVTADSVVVNIPPQDISTDLFRDVLTTAGSPAAASAGAAYVELSKSRVSIAFLLSVFNHESTFATNPAAIVVKYDTRNPGNCRTPRSGPYPVIDTPRGQFVQYPSWVAGWADLAFRLIDPSYVYVVEGRRTIRQIIERFAPATDGNAPDSYVNAVVADMNRWIESDAVAAEVPGFAWVPETAGEFGYPQGTHGRNGRTIDRLIIHATLGTDSLAWLTGAHGNSVHLLDNRNGTPRAQMVALADAAWGAGNRAYNLRGVNYEHECTEAEMLNPAYWTDSIIGNMAKIAADVIRLCPGILPDREHIIGHGDVPDQDHTDPGPAFPWERFIAAIQRELGQTPPPPEHGLPPTQPDPWRATNPYRKDIWVLNDFVAWINQHGFLSMGYVLLPAEALGELIVQYFERGRLEHHPDGTVTAGLVGRELLACQGRMP